MSTLAVGAIGVYRRYLSPVKGFRCAHAALHGRGSCSDFGLKVYGRHSLAKATAMMRRRFGECRKAYLVLMAAVAASATEDGEVNGSDPKRERSNKSEWACNGIDALNCATYPVPDAACADIGVCDCLGGLSI